MSQKIDFTTIKINPEFMQCGTVTAPLVVDGTTGNVATVTFPIPFKNPPHFVATMQLATGWLGSVTTGAVSETTASVLCRTASASGAGTNRQVNWIAIDPTQPPLIPV